MAGRDAPCRLLHRCGLSDRSRGLRGGGGTGGVACGEGGDDEGAVCGVTKEEEVGERGVYEGG